MEAVEVVISDFTDGVIAQVQCGHLVTGLDKPWNCLQPVAVQSQVFEGSAVVQKDLKRVQLIVIERQGSQVVQMDKDLSVQLFNPVVAERQKPQVELTIKGIG